MAALALGFVFVGSCDEDVTMGVVSTMMERDEAQLKEKWGRFLALGVALLYLGMYASLRSLVHAATHADPRVVSWCRSDGAIRGDDRGAQDDRSAARQGRDHARADPLVRRYGQRRADPGAPAGSNGPS